MTTLLHSLAVGLGGLVAFVPAGALAEEASRTLPPASNAFQVFAWTAAVLLTAFSVAALGYLYERRRGLHWDFQGDASHANEHH